MASMKDVAHAAGVSIATVSHVLRGTKKVSAAVSERVRDAALNLGYVPNLQASALRTGRTQTLGVLLPDLSNPFFPALLQALAPAARAAGLVLMVHEAENDADLELMGLERLAASKVAGLIWVPVDVNAPHAAYSEQEHPAAGGLPSGLPVVTIDRPVAGTDAVVADHAQGGRLMAAHLKVLGHGRVAVLSGPANLPSSRGRKRGFLEELAPLLPVWECEAGFTAELPGEARRLLGAGNYDAVACANDSLAIGVVRFLTQLGIRVPEDVSVIGFDDIPWAQLMDPPLTTVRQPLAAMGTAAVRLLLERIDDPHRATRRVVMPVELVVRASTAEPATLLMAGSAGTPKPLDSDATKGRWEA